MKVDMSEPEQKDQNMMLNIIAPSLKMYARPKLILFFILLSSTLNISSFSVDVNNYSTPVLLDDGWEPAHVKDNEMDLPLFNKLNSMFHAGKFQGVNSIVVVKNGKLVYEAYLTDIGSDSLQKIFSITKSVTSALIGIAIDKGMIGSIDDPIQVYFPEYVELFEDPKKQRITIAHLLTLTSGFDWDEKSYAYSDPKNSEYGQVRSSDWIKYVLEKEMRDEPGTKWEYNTGSIHLLSGIIRNSSGSVADEFAKKYLFAPLGIKDFEWNRDPHGNPCTGGTHGGLRMKVRDLAKIGYIYLNNGRWKDEQIVPKEWVEISTSIHVNPPNYNPIGLLWWRNSIVLRGKKIDYIYGAGFGGQSLTLIPELDLVIVFTCWTNAKDAAFFGPMLMIINSAVHDRV
jgi:CubicO group peptidase (beta-lactamase class C family)